jgi:hypothetical protein
VSDRSRCGKQASIPGIPNPGRYESFGMTFFKGNKQFLPEKPCATCGRPMTWRKRWAKNWDTVKYCSDACRRSR